jgi:hypothetical protein
MNQKTILQFSLSLLFILFSLTTKAAISSSQIDTLLVIQPRKQVEFNLKKKRRIFEKNERITYTTYETQQSISGIIYGFEGNALLIKDKEGIFHRVKISELKSIKRQSDFITVLSILAALITTGLIAMLLLSFLILFLIFQVASPYGLGLPPIQNILITLGISSFFGLLGFLGFRRSYKYKFNERWKADMVNIETEMK